MQHSQYRDPIFVYQVLVDIKKTQHNSYSETKREEGEKSKCHLENYIGKSNSVTQVKVLSISQKKRNRKLYY